MTAPKKTFDENKILGKMLYNARKRIGYTAKQLGELVDLREHSIRAIERGDSGLYIKTAVHLANLLGVDLNLYQRRVGAHVCGIEFRRRASDQLQQKVEQQKIALLRSKAELDRITVALPGEHNEQERRDKDREQNPD